MKKLFNRFVRDEEGQDLIEYALLASLIAVAGIVGASLIGPRIAQIWTDVVDAFAPGG
ncbi:MAG: Flp family type IVb pilin [Acidobacteria bacterium]|nr:Flp family type IVb pilin [Acidobacteriota bacterium]